MKTKHFLEITHSEKPPLFIVGVVRDVSQTLELEVQTILDAVSDFQIINWFLVESDSDDETLIILERLSNKYNNFKYVTLGNLRSQVPLRTARLALCRNVYMEYLDNNISGNELIMIADLDGANLDLSKESLRSISSRSDWSVVCANQRHAYFDIWALRHETWCTGDWIAEYQKLTIDQKLRPQKALKRALYSKMRHIPSGDDWIPVRSAFGGLAIYKAACIKGLRYEGLNENQEEICEHVRFNESISSKGFSMFIVPSLINCNMSTHTQILRNSIKLKTFIKRIIFG